MADKRVMEREGRGVGRKVSTVSPVDLIFSVADTCSSSWKNKDGNTTDCKGRLAVKMSKRS
jgi:hypothetical protein